MIRFFYKHRKWIYITVVATFLAGIFVGLGAYLGMAGTGAEVVAKAGKIQVTSTEFYKEYNKQMDSLAQSGLTEIPANLKTAFRQRVLQDIVVKRVFSAAAEDYDLRTTDFEIDAMVQSNPGFFRGGKFSPQIYAAVIAQAYKQTPAQFENDLRQSHSGNKFRSLLISSVKVTPQEEQASYQLLTKKDLKNFEKDRASFMQGLLQSKATSLLNSYLNQYIKDNGGLKDYLDTPSAASAG